MIDTLDTGKRILVHEATVHKLIKLIMDNEMKPGDKLPTERELCQYLNVSRTSLREAIQILTANYILTVRQGSGIYVDSINQTFVSRYVTATDEQAVLYQIRYLTQARIMLETFAFKETAKIITPEQVAMLIKYEENEYVHGYKTRKLPQSLMPASINLEHLIVSLQPNTYLTDFHNQLSRDWRSYFNTLNAVALPDADRHRDHMSIISAIETNNEKRIERLIHTHLQASLDFAESILSAGGQSEK